MTFNRWTEKFETFEWELSYCMNSTPTFTEYSMNNEGTINKGMKTNSRVLINFVITAV